MISKHIFEPGLVFWGRGAFFSSFSGANTFFAIVYEVSERIRNRQKRNSILFCCILQAQTL